MCDVEPPLAVFIRKDDLLSYNRSWVYSRWSAQSIDRGKSGIWQMKKTA